MMQISNGNERTDDDYPKSMKAESCSDKSFKFFLTVRKQLVIGLSLFAIIFVIYYVLSQYVFDRPQDPHLIFWTAIAAYATIALVGVAFGELRRISETATADFALKFKHDFFTQEARELIMLLKHELLEFKIGEDGLAYFELTEKENGSERSGITCHDFVREGRNKYSSYQMDDFLLAHIEDLGMFELKGILDIEYVYEGFSWYIVTVYENKQIQEYVKWLKKEYGEEIYDKLECIYHKVKEEEHKRAIKVKCPEK